MFKRLLLARGIAICLFFAIATPTYSTEEDTTTVWSLGTPDGSSIEFAPGARDELLFKVGESVLSRDFAGHQVGTIDWDPGSAEVERPYSVEFDLAYPLAGEYHLRRA